MPDHQDTDNYQEQTPLRKPQKADSEGNLTIHAERSIRYNSPIVPPEVLAEYANVLPDAPERIFAMVERQEAHRHHPEKTVVEAGAKNASRGITVTACIATLFAGVSAFMVYEHYVVQGMWVLGTTLAALVGVNIYGKSSQKKEREEKTRLLREDDAGRRKRRRITQSQTSPSSDENERRDAEETDSADLS